MSNDELPSGKPSGSGDSEGNAQRPEFPIVGIGASAGGLAAMRALVSRLVCDSMAYVVVQHLSPAHESVLAELLAREGPLAVVTARDGMIVEPNHVYVIPPGVNLAVFHGALQMIPLPSGRSPRFPIDFFFRSLAEELGPLAVGVVLSGIGTDGTDGLRAIKAAGGVTFVQDPASAQFDGMPRSAINAGFADFTLPADGIGAELSRIARHEFLRAVATRPPQALLHKLFVLVRDAFGNDLTEYKSATVERRVARRMALHHIARLDDYVEFATAHPDEVAALYRDVLIGVTSFFRDPAAWDALTREVFPQLLERKRPGDAIRVWSIGCATGEEAYSVAIALLEFLHTASPGVSVQIFATDAHAPAIESARRGSYAESIAQDVPPDLLARYFVPEGRRFSVVRRVREGVVFAQHNVARDAPFSRLDLVLCRNVLIYLQPSLQRRVLNLAHYALQPDGFLMLGNSEGTTEASNLFSVQDAAHKIYRARRAANAVTLGGRSRPSLLVARSDAYGAVVSRPPPTLQQIADRIVLDRYSPPGVLLNESNEVVQFRGQTSAFLAPAPGSPTFNVLKLARPEIANELRDALRQAHSERAAVRVQAPRAPRDASGAVTEIEVVPLRTTRTTASGTLVLFGRAPDGNRIERAVTASGTEAEQVEALRRELASVRHELHAAIAELETANEELRTTNEQLQSNNEELQSTNEEMETSREELQSSNEEVLTTNDELRARVSEFGQHSDDLANILSDTQVVLLVVGPDLRIRRASRAAERALDLESNESHRRSLFEVRGFFAPIDIEAVVARVLRGGEPFEGHIRGANQESYQTRVMPYLNADQQVSGTVIECWRTEAPERGAELAPALIAYCARVLLAVSHPVVIVDEKLFARWANEPFFRRFGVGPGTTLGRLVPDLGTGRWAGAEFRSALEQTLRNGSIFHDLVVPHPFAAHDAPPMRTSASPILGLPGHDRFAVLAFEDVEASPHAGTPPTAKS